MRNIIIIGVTVLTAVLLPSSQAQVEVPPRVPQGQAETKAEAIRTDPKLEDFVGKWAGKWDGIYEVQFTITRSEEEGSVQVVYEWEEQLGRGLRRMERVGTLEGDKLNVGDLIDLSLIRDDADRAKAYGNFRNPRTAQLRRMMPDE